MLLAYAARVQQHGRRVRKTQAKIEKYATLYYFLHIITNKQNREIKHKHINWVDVAGGNKWLVKRNTFYAQKNMKRLPGPPFGIGRGG